MQSKLNASKGTHALPESLTQLYTPQHIAVPQPSYIPIQNSQRAPYKTNDRRHDTMGYPYQQDTTYPCPLRNPPFPSAHQADNKYQARRSKIPDQQNKCSNVIQHHVLQEQQCLLSGSLDNKPITILIYKGSSISPLDEQLYYSLSSVPPLQPLPFSVSGADDKPHIHCYRRRHISSATCCN